MTKADIITLPNPKLRQTSKRIGHIDQSVKTLAADMIAALVDWESSREHEVGAALAAIQVAEPLRLIVIRDDFDDKANHSFGVYINPEIVKYEGEPSEDMEGCLSVADIYGQVARYPKVKIKALNLDGQEVRITATDFLARVFQHEIDHIKGKLFVDHVTDPAKLYRLEPSGNFSALGHDLAY